MVKWPGNPVPGKYRYGNGVFDVRPFFDTNALNTHHSYILVPGDTARLHATTLTLDEVLELSGVVRDRKSVRT